MRTPHPPSSHQPSPHAPSPRPGPYGELAALDAVLDDGTAEYEYTPEHEYEYEYEYVDDGPEHDGSRWTRTPADHRGPRKRGFRGLPMAAKLVVLAAILAVLALVTDRWAALYAGQRAGGQVQRALHLPARPQVDIAGFPFLTQALDGRLARATVTVPDVPAGPVTLASVTVTATGIHPLGSLPAHVRGARIDRIDGDAALEFADMKRELGSSQVSYRRLDARTVAASGALPAPAGQTLHATARADIRYLGHRRVTTRVHAMRFRLGDIAVYRPGHGAADGLHLSRQSAALLARNAAKVRALFRVDSIVRRLGVPPRAVRLALRSDDRLRRLAGTPRFVHALMRINLLDEIEAHPWVLAKVGLDPKLVAEAKAIRVPKVADRLQLDFRLPKLPGNLALRGLEVRRDGIHARFRGTGLAFGKK